MNILFLGGDQRMSHAASIISQSHEVFCGKNLPAGDTFPVIVLPVPLTKNGSDIFAPMSPEPIPLETVPRFAEPNALILAGGKSEKLSALCGSLRLVNYFASETLTLRNAALTAEAAVSLLVQSTDGSLLGSRVLITGYGRISRELALRLAAFGADCTIAARRRDPCAEAQLHGFRAFSTEKIPAHIAEFDFIANTVPAPLFSPEDFAQMRPGCVFMELASLPNTPPTAPNVRYIHAPGLPGRYSPKTAGKFIADELLRYLP